MRKRLDLVIRFVSWLGHVTVTGGRYGSESTVLHDRYCPLQPNVLSDAHLVFPTLVVYGAGTVRLLDMFRAGFAPEMACLTLQILSLEFLGWAVLDIKTFPEWAEARYASRRQMLYNVSTISSVSTVYNGSLFGNASVIDALANATSVI